MNAFEELGLERRLTLPDEQPDKAFREAGARKHPDAGGSEEVFARLREAYALLSSPSRRLRHWLELSGHVPDARGTVGSGLMDLFGRIDFLTRAADEVIRKRAGTKSALALALTEGTAQQRREEIEALLAQVETEIAAECAVFPAIENGDLSLADERVRNLAFLEKWRASLRALFAGLV